MNINKETCMSTRTKFQDIREELNRDYYNFPGLSDGSACQLFALKKAIDELLKLLDDAVS